MSMGRAGGILRHRRMVGHHPQRMLVRIFHEHPVRRDRARRPVHGYTQVPCVCGLNHDGDMSAAAEALKNSVA